MLQFLFYFGGDIDSERNCSKHFTNSIFYYIFHAFDFDLLSSFPVPFTATTCFFQFYTLSYILLALYHTVHRSYVFVTIAMSSVAAAYKSQRLYSDTAQ